MKKGNREKIIPLTMNNSKIDHSMKAANSAKEIELSDEEKNIWEIINSINILNASFGKPYIHISKIFHYQSSNLSHGWNIAADDLYIELGYNSKISLSLYTHEKYKIIQFKNFLTSTFGEHSVTVSDMCYKFLIELHIHNLYSEENTRKFISVIDKFLQFKFNFSPNEFGTINLVRIAQ